MTPNITLDLGGRYSWEEKSAKTATFSAVTSVCDYRNLTCNYDFPGPRFAGSGTTTFDSFTPKIGLNWTPAERVLIYATFSQGIRSGGYNVRNTSPVTPPGPYGEERQDAYELGLKADFLDRRLRINASGFHNVLNDLQRDVIVPDPVLGSVQTTRNVGKATVNGVELEVTALIGEGFRFGASAGYLEDQYDELSGDLNGALPGLGIDLALVRLSPWSYGVNASYETRFANGYEFTSRIDFGHRDEQAANDANTAFLRPLDELSANLAITDPSDRFTVSVYGRNLLDRVTDTIKVSLPPVLGGAFVGINKGRVIGASIDFRF